MTCGKAEQDASERRMHYAISTGDVKLDRIAQLTRPVVHLLQLISDRLVAQDVIPSKLDASVPQQPYNLPAESALWRTWVALHEENDLVTIHKFVTSGLDLFLALAAIRWDG
jgi:hypothetical protein